MKKPTATGLSMLETILRLGGDIRICSISSGRFPMMHFKSQIFDMELAAIGSHNFTRNSAENCVEAMVFTRISSTLYWHIDMFGSLFHKSNPLTLNLLEIYKRKREASSSSSRSKSRERFE